MCKWLRSDKYTNQIQELRSLEDKAKRDKIKSSLPAITVSGTFHPTRKEENLVQHSGLICIDIDWKGNEHVANFSSLKEQLFHIENVAYAGLSASGKGFFLIIPIAYPKRHKKQFAAIHRDFSSLGLAIDTAPKNVASLRGYSWDADALFRHQAKPYRKWWKVETVEKKKLRKLDSPSFNSGMDTKDRVERLIQHIVDNRIDITEREEDWFRLACAFANEFGEEGRGYFHAVSQFHSKYNPYETNKKYNHALKGKYSSICIGTFLRLAKNIAQ